MDPKLQQALADYMQSLLSLMKESGQMVKDGIQQGAAFAKDQIPLVIQEKLHFTLAIDIVWALMWLSILIAGWVFIRKVMRPSLSPRDAGVDWCFGGILTGVSLIAIMMNVYEIVKVYTAPRLFIIDWITQLYQQVKH